MKFSNVIYFSKNIFFYDYTLNSTVHRIYFVKDISLPYESARISINENTQFNTKDVIYYNISDHTEITDFAPELDTITRSFILNKTFSTPNQYTIGSWVSYDTDLQSYIIRFNFIFHTNKNYSSIPTCSYLTCSSNVSNSENYHYANSSKGTICSNPILIKKNQGQVSYCTMSFTHPVECSHYKKDHQILSEYLVSSKYSSETFTFTSSISRFIDHILLSINNDSNETIFNVKLFNLDNISREDLLCESNKLMNEALSSYSSQYFNIEKREISDSISVSAPKKKSYISTLI